MEGSQHSFKNIRNFEDYNPSQHLDIPTERIRHPSSVSFELVELSESEKDNIHGTSLEDPRCRSLRSQSVLSRMSVNSWDFGLIKRGIGLGILTVTVFVFFVIWYNWWSSQNMK